MVEYITYKGQTYPFRISYIALKKFEAETGKTIDQTIGRGSMQHLDTLLYHAMVVGHRMLDRKMELNKKDIEWVLDESMGEFQEKMLKFFPDLTDAQGEAGDEKK